MSSILKVDTLQDVNGNAIISSDGSGNLTPNTFTGLTISGNLSVDGGTIKLDGNYPINSGNVALGDATLLALTSGANNVAVGNLAMNDTTSGDANVAVGGLAMYENTTGNSNTGIGNNALRNNLTGNYNTAIGQ